MKQLELEIYGRVQGIRFRSKIRKFANLNMIKGFVMNRDDGSMLLVAQGKDENLQNLISWINSNPGLSKIENLDEKWKEMNETYDDFRIISEENFFVDKTKSIWNLMKYYLVNKGGAVDKIPAHIAIIPDGNRRWAKQRGLSGRFGHYKASSYNNLESLFNEARNLGAKYVSIWAFSTENWSRDKNEIKAIFDVVIGGVDRFLKDATKNKIRFRHFGRKDRIPKELASKLEKLEKETEIYSDFNVQLCLDYGGRDELLRAVNSILKSDRKKVEEKEFSEFLDTKEVPDVDLVIRTSGEHRTSGFMPFQSVYAELYFADVFFPEFDAEELRKAIEEYSRRQRRFGK